MTSIGWHLGRVTFWLSLAVAAVIRGPSSSLSEQAQDDPQQQCIYEESQDDVPSSLSESAFEDHLYHQLHHPAYLTFDCMPQHIHLSQASDVNPHHHRVNMTVSFTLSFADHHCEGAIPHVVYSHGLHPEEKATSENKLQFNFTSSLTGEYYDSDWIYHVTLPNLKAGSKEYSYRIVLVVVEENNDAVDDENEQQVAVDTNVRFSRRRRRLRASSSDATTTTSTVLQETPTFQFKTPPKPGSPTAIALVGDLGQTTNSTKTMAHIHKATLLAATADGHHHHPVAVSMLLIVGDMSYADSDPHRWPSWFEVMEPLLRSTPLQVAAGNHEVECDATTWQIFQPFEHYFSNANRVGPAEGRSVDPEYRKTLWNQSCSTPSAFRGHYDYGNSFYAVQHGLAQVIVLNSYTDSTPDSAQYQWLLGTLQAIDRSQTPWIIVGFHCPLYTTFVGHNDEVQTVQMKKHMEPLFVQYGVNIIVAGHDHAYSRSYPLAFDQLDPAGPVYLALGAGGNREQHSRGYLHPDDQKEEWVAKRDNVEYGYGNLLLQNATHAHFNWVRDGTTEEGVQDHVWLINAHV